MELLHQSSGCIALASYLDLLRMVLPLPPKYHFYHPSVSISALRLRKAVSCHLGISLAESLPFSIVSFRTNCSCRYQRCISKTQRLLPPALQTRRGPVQGGHLANQDNRSERVGPVRHIACLGYASCFQHHHAILRWSLCHGYSNCFPFCRGMRACRVQLSREYSFVPVLLPCLRGVPSGHLVSHRDAGWPLGNGERENQCIDQPLRSSYGSYSPGHQDHHCCYFHVLLQGRKEDMHHEKEIIFSGSLIIGVDL